jgi:hypothetical protein
MRKKEDSAQDHAWNVRLTVDGCGFEVDRQGVGYSLRVLRDLERRIPRETWDADGWGLREKQLI